MPPRPRLHFTADEGWINDPYGITWDGMQYHLFFQAIPGRTDWAPNCHWGHATSPDLVTWTEQPHALVPQDFENGCWSGCVVADERKLFYSRVSGTDHARASIATASGDASLMTWTTSSEDIVVAEGPPEAWAFRDPMVFRHDGIWTMIVGAGLRNGSGAALHYRSDDLVTWTYDGVLCERPSSAVEPVTGEIWECPQLFEFGDEWVLLVSVWHRHSLLNVVAAQGSYDGHTFRPRVWQPLTHGDCAYAMTTFLDRNGRRCVLSWLREVDDTATKPRAGAHSVPAVLVRKDDGTLALAPHPAVAEYVDDDGVLTDGDIVEVFGAEGYRAYRA